MTFEEPEHFTNTNWLVSVSFLLCSLYHILWFPCLWRDLWYLQRIWKIDRPSKPVISTFPILKARVVLSAIFLQMSRSKNLEISGTYMQFWVVSDSLSNGKLYGKTKTTLRGRKVRQSITRCILEACWIQVFGKYLGKRTPSEKEKFLGNLEFTLI